MKVLHIQKVAGISGSERHLLGLLPELQRRGIDVQMCVLRTEGSSEFERHLERSGVSVVGIEAGPDVSVATPARISKLVRRFQPDLVHTHLIHGNLYGQLAARFSSRAGIVSLHSAHSLLVKQPARSATVFSLRNARLVIAISRFVADLAAEQGLVPKDKLRVIHYGIDDGQWTEHSPADPSGGEAFTVGVVGRLIQGKGHEWLFRAFARAKARVSPPMVLHVAGDGPLKERLEALADDLGVADDVRFFGHVDDIERFIGGCNVMVVPTLPELSEGFGLAALEGMAAGRTVIASRTGPLPELIEDGRSGLLVSPGDVEELEDTLVRVEASGDVRSEYGAAAKARAVSSFSLDAAVDKTVRVYEEVFRRPSP